MHVFVSSKEAGMRCEPGGTNIIGYTSWLGGMCLLAYLPRYKAYPGRSDWIKRALFPFRLILSLHFNVTRVLPTMPNLNRERKRDRNYSRRTADQFEIGSLRYESTSTTSIEIAREDAKSSNGISLQKRTQKSTRSKV